MRNLSVPSGSLNGTTVPVGVLRFPALKRRTPRRSVISWRCLKVVRLWNVILFMNTLIHRVISI